jgi:hypothetical protein
VTTLIAAIVLGQATPPTFKARWTVRLQTEIQSTALDEKLIYFGTNDAYGAIDQGTGRKTWSKSFASPQLGAYVAAADGVCCVSIGQGKLHA